MLENLVRANQATLRQKVHVTDGDIFVLRAERLSLEDRILLMTAARVILLSRQGTLERSKWSAWKRRKLAEVFFLPSNTAQLLKARRKPCKKRIFAQHAPH